MFSQRTVLLAGVLIGILLNAVFLFYTVRHPDVSPGTGEVAIPLVSPFQEYAGSLLGTIRKCWHTYFALVSVAEENRNLHAELRAARAGETRCTETELAGTRLRELLRLRRTMDAPVLAAEVIARDPSPWYSSITVNRGTEHGVRKGLPVVVPEGVVGVISHVSGRHARVLLLTDPNSAADVLVQRTRARGMVKGESAGLCTCEYVLHRHEVTEDDILVTSGLDGIFPKGLRVGRVAEVLPVTSGIFQKIRVIPFANFEKLEEVLIILRPAAENGEAPR